jgi:hypothetical protein
MTALCSFMIRWDQQENFHDGALFFYDSMGSAGEGSFT